MKQSSKRLSAALGGIAIAALVALAVTPTTTHDVGQWTVLN